jgi:hypothetical protein
MQATAPLGLLLPLVASFLVATGSLAKAIRL